MNIIFNGRTIENHFKGSQKNNRRKFPRKPVRWTGKFLVADAAGNAREAEWLPESGELMTYMEAREAALNLIDSLTAMVHAEYNLPIKKVTFNLVSR